MLRFASIHCSLSLSLSLSIHLSLLSNPFRTCLVIVQEAPLFRSHFGQKLSPSNPAKFLPSFDDRLTLLFILVSVPFSLPFGFLTIPTFPGVIHLLRFHTYVIERSIDVYTSLSLLFIISFPSSFFFTF